MLELKTLRDVAALGVEPSTLRESALIMRDLNTLHVAARRPQGDHSSRGGPGVCRLAGGGSRIRTVGPAWHDQGLKTALVSPLAPAPHTSR
jgi:hypothetical protein